MTLEARLSALGVTKAEFENLLFLFGPEYSRYQMTKYDETLDTMDPGGPRPGWGGLTLEELADHFLHRRYVLGSTRVVDGWASWEEDDEEKQYIDFASPLTGQVTLDLDVHSVEQLMTIKERYGTLRSLFKPTPLVFQSSASRGLHLTWFLADLMPVNEVVERTNRVLASTGCGLRKGDGVEIFPTSKANLLRIPLGAGGALLDPETLLPVDLSFPEIYRMVMKAWETASELEDLFRPLAAQIPPEGDEEDDRPSPTEADHGEAPPKRDLELERKLWEEGLSAEHALQEAQFHIIRYCFYIMHKTDEEALSEAVIGWVSEKNHGYSNKYNADPESVEEEILGLVQEHLDWVAEDPVRRGGGPDRSLRLTEGDYRAIVKMAPKVMATGHLLDVKQSHVQEGIAALLLYVKQRCGPFAKSPTVPIPAIDLRDLPRWGNDRERSNDYGHWLDALKEAGILVVADADYSPGGGTGKCRTYTLYYDFCDGDPVEDHQAGFDATLGPGKVKTLRRGTRLRCAAVEGGGGWLVVTDRPPTMVAAGDEFGVYDLSQERLLDPDEVQALSERGEAEPLDPGESSCSPTIDLDDPRGPPVDPVERDRVLTEMGLESFIRIPFGTSGPLESRGVGEYRVATTVSEVHGIVHTLMESGRYALYAEAMPDTEGGGMILAFVDGEGRTSCVLVGGQNGAGEGIGVQVARDLLSPLLADTSCPGVVDDVKSTGRLLRALGLPVVGLQFDVALAAYLLEPDRESLSLDIVASDWLGVWREPTEDDQGEGSISRCCEGAMMVRELAEKLRPLIVEEGLTEVLEDVEIPFAFVLGEMEDVGFAVDIGLLEGLEGEFRAEKEKARDDVHRAAGRSFNLESHREVRRQFKRLGLPVGRRTKRGVPSITQEVLKENMDKHPVVPAFSRYRTMAGLLSIAASSLKAGKEGQGRVYPQMHQAGSETGRISVSKPPLQGMPVRTAEGRRLREAFIPSPGCLLISADYSQIELRVLAHLAGDPKLLEDFKAGVDVHARTAIEVFKAVEDNIHSLREAAKPFTFGIIYGRGPASLAEGAKFTKREARNYKKKWFRRHRRVQEFRKELLERAREHGEVRSLLGRPLPIRKLDRRGERKVLSHVVQGSAADLMKLAMIQLHRRLGEEGWDARILLQVHDELILEAKESQAEKVGELTKAVMAGAMDLDTPLVVNVYIGRNWAEVSK